MENCLIFPVKHQFSLFSYSTERKSHKCVNKRKGNEKKHENKQKNILCVCVCMLGSVVHVLFIYFVAHLHWTQYNSSENSSQ